MNALKHFLAGVIGFGVALLLSICLIISMESNVMIEKQFTVWTELDSQSVEVKCSVTSPILMPFQKEFQVTVKAHGFQGPLGFVSHSTVVANLALMPHQGRYITGYNTMLVGYTSFHGQVSRDEKIAGKVTDACIANDIYLFRL